MVSYAIFSGIGNRLHNEDYAGTERLGNEYGFFLADGLGGHNRGDAAAQIAVKEAKEQFFVEGASCGCVRRIFDSAQKSILRYQRDTHNESSMRTTLCALLISEIDICWAHIGDTRLYYFQEGHLKEQTKDHSVPQMLVNSGMLTADRIRFHPDRNRLVQCMGIPWEGEPYECAKAVSREGRQEFLLCTDGYWELIEESEIERALKLAASPGEWLDNMAAVIEKKKRGRDRDNWSAIAVWSDEEAVPT